MNIINKNNVFNILDESLVRHFLKHNMTANDLFCRECKRLLFDIEFAKSIVCKFEKTVKGQSVPLKQEIFCVNGKITAVEPEEMRWILIGKNIFGKQYFRHLCWDCFYKHLGEVIDIPHAARKSKWYFRILNGEKPIPPREVNSSDYFKLIFDIDDDILQRQKEKVAVSSLKHFIDKYGKNEGQIKYYEYRKRQAYTCSKEYMMNEKGMTEEEWIKFNHDRSSTLENFIKRYGQDDGTKRWNNYCAYESYAGNSLKWFIDKLGEYAGRKKYEQVCSSKEFAIKHYSEVSQKLFKELDTLLGEYGKKSRWETKNFEYEIYVDTPCGKRLKKVDYYLNGKIIEFNGDFWHMNPSIYQPNDTRKNFDGTEVIAKELWENEKKRINAIKKLGYEVKVIWESEYYDNKQKVIDDCIQFLKTNNIT